jgi:hypothetical protein
VRLAARVVYGELMEYGTADMNSEDGRLFDASHVHVAWREHRAAQLSREKSRSSRSCRSPIPPRTRWRCTASACPRNDELDEVSAAALAAGGSEADDAEDYGFMYSRSCFGLDGHGWQVMWMDPAAAEQGPEAFATSMQDSDSQA